MSNVRQSVGVPISDDFADNTGTPLVVNGANGDGYVKKADGTITKIGSGQATTNANLTGVVTSVGNATSIANGAISNAMLANGAVANLSGTNTGDQNIPSAILSALGLNSYFTSTAQTITAAGALTLAHGLAREPILFQVMLVNTTAELGYSIGDKLSVQPGGWFNSVQSLGVSIVPNATNLNIRFGSSVNTYDILNKTTGVAAGITNANWNIIFRAWA